MEATNKKNNDQETQENSAKLWALLTDEQKAEIMIIQGLAEAGMKPTHR